MDDDLKFINAHGERGLRLITDTSNENEKLMVGISDGIEEKYFEPDYFLTLCFLNCLDDLNTTKSLAL